MSSNIHQDQSDSIRRGVERRLEFIEYRLFWEGGVNRSDITSRFGVSVPQASNDLTLYRERAPHNIRYDASGKRYLPTKDFAPLFLKPNASHYLVELKAVADKVLAPDDSWIGMPPEVDGMPIPGRRVDSKILRILLEAIRSKQSINAYYHSIRSKRPDPIWRRITPHAFGFDGLRWHVRAYCHIDERFKDFLLSRFLKIGELGPAAVEATSDHAWFSYFDVVLIPNPDLAESKRRSIELDYSMQDGQLVLKVRCALLYYFNKRLRLDVDKGVDEPYERPVVIANRSDFDNALRAASE